MHIHKFNEPPTSRPLLIWICMQRQIILNMFFFCLPNILWTKYCGKLQSVGLMKNCYILSVIPTLFPSEGCVITLNRGNNKTFLISIYTISQCSCPEFINMSAEALGWKGQWMKCNHIHCVFRYFCKLNQHTDAFIHASTLSHSSDAHP